MFNRRLLSLLVAISATGAVQAQAQTTETAADNDIAVEEVYVQGIRNAELNAREEERNKEAFSSVIAQDDAGDFADQNVAESLQRLPGVTLQKSEGEGQRINLRGLGPQFVNVTINGSELASAGGDVSSDDRGFGLDVISADMLGGIEVNKTILPSMDTYSTAGSVNLKTVSAFDKKRDSLKIKAQINEQFYREELNPKLSLSGTNLFFDDTVGLGYSLSGEKRKTVNYENLHHDDIKPQFIDPQGSGTPMLVPYESQIRQEDAERTRLIGSLDLGWRPTDNSEYKLQFSHTEYEDLDIAIREYYRFYGGDYATAMNPENSTFVTTDAEVQQQFFIQKAKVKTDSFGFAGEHTFGDEWALDYRLAYSSSLNEKPDGRRVQFRVRDMAMVGVFGEDFIGGRPISKEQLDLLSTGYTGEYASGTYNGADAFGTDANGELNAYQPSFQYDNIFIEDSTNEDTIGSFNLNVTKEFEGGVLSSVKAGIQLKDRERTRDRNRVSLVPRDYQDLCYDSDGVTSDAEKECALYTLATTYESDYIDTYMPSQPEFNFEHITYGSAESLLSKTRAVADNFDADQTDQSSRDEDYVITEKSSAAYVQLKFELSDEASIITGLRYNTTDYESSGNFTIRNDRFEESNQPESLDISVPLTGTAKSYTDIHPSIHFRYDPADEYQFRAALWTSGTRPGFNQARAYAKFDGRISFCNNDQTDPLYGVCSDNPDDNGALSLADVKERFVVDSDNTFEIGNPVLDPMSAINLDASFAWNPSDDMFFQVAGFYKDIKDFIVEVRGKSSSIESLPVTLPLANVPYFNFVPNTVYENVNFWANGDSAVVYGVELSFAQYFEQGIFVQSNATLLDSEADMGADLRADTIKLPNMAGASVNLVVGWENEIASVRLISNYTSEILDKVGSCTAADIASDAGGVPYDCESWNDIYYAPAVNIDFKATYKVSDDVSFYFDATNLTKETNSRYFDGNSYSNGHMMFRHEDFGTSVQFGVNWKLY